MTTHYTIPETTPERTWRPVQQQDSSSRGIRLRVMEWNIWQGGREAGGERNVDQLIEFIRQQHVDILFMLETYGSGDKILAGLNAGRPEDDRFSGIRITHRPEPNRDNLWIFTRFPVVKEHPRTNEQALSSFNFGGVKIKLPTGRKVHLFNTWLWHEGPAWGRTHQTVGEILQGKKRTFTEAEILATDLERRFEMAKIILDDRLPRYVQDDDAIILAGDLNTLPYLDWIPEFAGAPGHAGLVLPWPVTQLFYEAGFVDTYRTARPDAGRFPGSTWSPLYGYGHAPGRIDYIFVRGDRIRVLDSFTLDKRLPGHEHPKFPFYSDHAAVVSDLLFE